MAGVAGEREMRLAHPIAGMKARRGVTKFAERGARMAGAGEAAVGEALQIVEPDRGSAAAGLSRRATGSVGAGAYATGRTVGVAGAGHDHVLLIGDRHLRSDQ